MAVLSMVPRRRGEFVRLQLGTGDIGVLLLDPQTGRLHMRLREDWEGAPGDRELLEHLEDDLRQKAGEMGGEALLAWMEDTLSNAILITDREPVEVDSFTRVLDRLYSRYVGDVPVRRFETHLPLYSLPVAAGNLGEETPAEAEEWVRVPPRKLTKDMFVAPVVGRSMEPLIPVGSLNLFRYGVVGSRQNRIVLVEAPTLEEGGRYTVKKYTSRKVARGEDEWEHEWIRLVPVNPEYPTLEFRPDEVRVIAEWLGVVE